jgi:hypothetical protein
MSVFPRLFWILSRFRVFRSDGSSKALQKNVLQKNRFEKCLPKNRPKIQKRFFVGFILSRFWPFHGEESPKTPPKNPQKI